MSKDRCFAITISEPLKITNDLESRIVEKIKGLYRNKKFKGYFTEDEDLPFDVYTGLRWKKRKAVCLKMTSRAKDNIERVKKINDQLVGKDMEILKGVRIELPEEVKFCDFERAKKKKGDILRTTLEHNGPYFKHLLDPYEPFGAVLVYDGKDYPLNAKEEEAAVFYARRLITEETSAKKFITSNDKKIRDAFNQNYWDSFKEYLTPEHSRIFKNFSKFDFSKIVAQIKKKKAEIEKEKEKIKGLKEALKNKDLSDSKRLKIQKLLESYKGERVEDRIKKLENKLNYGFAFVDGNKKEIRNYSVELAGLYIGAGNVMTNKGKIKKAVYPEDVTINVSKGFVPEPPKGTKWGAVVDEPRSAWLAKYKDSITGQYKYVFIAESGDLFKFEKARKLNKFIDEVREKYSVVLNSSSEKERQIGTIVYLIDNYGLRAGSKEGEDDDMGGEKVVGASTLQVENVKLKKKGYIDLKFYGKDSVFFDNTLKVSDLVYNNISSFLKGKTPKDPVFDLVTASDVNEYLKSIDRDFTAKVFRTRLASSIMYEGLKKLKFKKDTSEAQKLVDFNEVNKQVAVKLNHKKTPTEKQKARYTKLKEEFEGLKETDKNYEKKRLELETLRQKLEVSPETSKKNYIDPRIVKSWCERADLPVEKVYKTEALKKHFAWALEDDEINEDWDYVETPLDCIVGDELIPSDVKDIPKLSSKSPSKSPSKSSKIIKPSIKTKEVDLIKKFCKEPTESNFGKLKESTKEIFFKVVLKVNKSKIRNKKVYDLIEDLMPVRML